MSVEQSVHVCVGAGGAGFEWGDMRSPHCSFCFKGGCFGAWHGASCHEDHEKEGCKEAQVLEEVCATGA